MSEQKIKFGVDFDTKAASSAVDELRTKLASLGGLKDSEGVKALNAQLKQLGSRMAEAGKQAQASLGAALSKILTSLRIALKAVAAAAAVAGAAIAAGLGMALKKGVGSNTALEDLRTGLAATVSSLYDLRDATGAPLQGLQRFEAAAAQAQSRLAQLRKETAETGYAQEHLGAALNAGLGLGAAAGLDADAVQSLVRDIAIASTAVGTAGENLTNEIKALFAGQGLEESKLGRALALNPQLLQTWKQQGTLVSELNMRLSDVKATALAAEQGMGQLQGRLTAGVSNALAGATAGAYETLKSGLADALNKLFDENGEVATRYQGLYQWSMRMFDALAQGVSAGIGKALDGLAGVSGWLEANTSAIENILGSFSGMKDSVISVLRPLGSLTAGVDDAASAGEMLVTVFEIVERLFASLADVAKVAMGGIGTAIGGLGTLVGEMGAALGEKLGMESLTRGADGLARASRGLMQSSAETVRSGLTLERSVATAAAISQRQHERALKLVKDMQTASADAPAKAPTKANDLRASPLALMTDPAALESARKAAEVLAMAQLDATRRAFADQQELLKARLDRDVQLSLVSKREELTKRQKLEADALDFEQAQANIARQKASKTLTSTTDPAQSDGLRAEILKIDATLASIASKGKVLKIKAELDAAALDAQIAAMAKQLSSELDALQSKPEDLAAARIAALEAELVKESPRLQELVNKVFDAKAATQQFEEAAGRVDAVHSKLAAAEADIQRAYADAAITTLEAEEKLKAVRLESLEALKSATAEMKAGAAGTGNQKLIAEAEAASGAIAELDSKTRELSQRTVKGLQGEFKSAFMSITTGAKSFSDGLMDLFTSLLGKLSEKFATQAFESLFAGAGGSKAGSGWLGSLLSAFGGAFATGGLIRGPGTGTSDQVPILASNGEYVMKASVVKEHFSLLNYLNQTGSLPAMRSGGGAVGLPRGLGESGGFGTVQNSIHVSPQVVIQTGQLIDALQGDAGFERTIVQLVSANKRRLGV